MTSGIDGTFKPNSLVRVNDDIQRRIRTILPTRVNGKKTSFNNCLYTLYDRYTNLEDENDKLTRENMKLNGIEVKIS